jgi:hypothetical protein
VNKREHFERWIKFLKPIAPDLSLEFNEERGFYLDPRVNLAYEAWLASPKTRPTEPSKITKEQLAAMKADTSDIVDHLRGIYPGIVDAYPVSPLQKKAADEIERLRHVVTDLAEKIRRCDYTQARSDALQILTTTTTTKEP